MLFISIDDFFAQVEGLSPILRQEELACAERMKSGDEEARQRLIEGYLPMVASHIRHASPKMQKLGLVTECVFALEKAVDLAAGFVANTTAYTAQIGADPKLGVLFEHCLKELIAL